MREDICHSCHKTNFTFVLDCGFRVCRDHFESINNGPKMYSCNFCRKKHSYSDCSKIISNKITEIDYDLELKIEEAERKVHELNEIKKHKNYFRNENYKKICKTIEMKKEEILNSFKIDLNNHYEKVLATLDNIYSNIEDKIKKKYTFNQLDYMENTFNEILNNKDEVPLSERLNYLNEKIKVIDSFTVELDRLKEEIDKIKTIDFIEEKTTKLFTFDNSFGKFKLENDYVSETGLNTAFVTKAQTQEKIENHKSIESLKNLKKINEIKAHFGKITALDVLSNGDIVTGSSDGLVKIWNLNDGTCKKVLSGICNRVKCFKVLPNDTIAVCSDTKRNDSYFNYSTKEIEFMCSQIRIYDSVTGSCDKIIHSPSSICSIEFVENDILVTGHDNGSIYFCNKNSGEYLSKMENTHDSMVCCLIKLNNNYLVSSSDYTIKVWNLDQNKCTRTFNENISSILYLAKLNDTQFLSCSQYGSIKLWDINKDKFLNNFEIKKEIKGLFALDIDRFLLCSADQDLILWSFKDDHKNEEKCLTFNDNIRIYNSYFFNNQIIITHQDSIRIYSLE